MFILCWTTYVITYLCRINFSSCLSKLADGFNTTGEALGFTGSLFFAAYAVGQLINGYLGDRISPYRFVLVAIISTAVINLMLSFTSSLPVFMVLWCLNGYVQSMLWGPLMRILSQNFLKEAYANVSTGMSTSMVVGFGFSWAFFGRLFLNLSWQYYFVIPSILAFLISGFWINRILRKSSPETVGMPQDAPPIPFKELVSIIIKKQLWIIAIICLCLGIIKESLSLWAPLILTKVLGFDIKSSFLFILIIPIANFLGIMVSRKLTKIYASKIKTALAVMFSATVAASSLLIVMGIDKRFLSIVLIAMVSGLMYGCNNILLSYIPLSFSYKNIVSVLVGVFDFCSYAGAAISSLVLGIIMAGDNYDLIFIIWIVVSLTALVLSLICKMQRKHTES